jgi:cobalt transporter subunit CbtB
MRDRNPPVGETGKGVNDMTTKALAIARADTRLAAIAAVFLAGAALLFISGYAQATVLHDAAHDSRHAMAFPCH